MKKKLLALLLVVAFALGSMPVNGFATNEGVQEQSVSVEESVYSDLGEMFAEEDRDVNVGYLLRENFTVYNSGGSGWEQVNMPGGVGIGTISRKSSGIESYIKKAFVAQSGEVTVEFKTILISNVTAGFVSILGRSNGREVEAVRIRIEESMFKYVDGDGNKTDLYKISSVNWTGFKIVANAETGKVTVFVNGVAVPTVTDVTMFENCESLCGVKFGLTATSTGAYSLGTVSVYKGYDVNETFNAAGVATVYDVNYDYNSKASANITVDDHTIQNDNNNQAHLAFDGNDETYWEHNKKYEISKNVYFMVNYSGNVVGIDTIRLKFASYYKGMISITYQTPDDAWDAWGGGKYSWMKYETTEENGYELVMEIDAPHSLVQIALGLQVGEDGYNIANQEIKLASFETYCRNPIKEEIADYPSDWARVTPENTTVTTYGFYGSSASVEFNTVRIADKNATESAYATKSFERAGDFTLEFKSFYEDMADGNVIGVENEDGNFIGVTTYNGKLNVVQTVEGQENLTEIINEENALSGYLANLWYQFELVYNSEENSLNLSLNGWTPIDDVQLDGAFADKKWTGFVAASAEGETAFQIDNVKIWKTQAQSNVPELNRCDTGDTVLTMQACSLWREGSHIGWGAIDNEEMAYRQPILGWYDEGTAEVADWEIKMAVDHGISNFMYCWYRNGSEGPIAGSNYGDAIWDGLFKSKFRDQMKFTLMFENTTGLYSYNDLIENLMPYWIEVFFKNPNYFKTADGIPVFYVYNYSNFMSAIGDVNKDGATNTADVKVATDKMREMCVEAGLPGLYLAAEDRASSASTVRNIENCGFDSLFAYTFSTGTYNVSDDETFASAKNVMLNQREAITDTEKFAVIPNISKSWDTRGWTQYGFGNATAPYMYDLEHYREYALWVKNVFGGATIDSKGTKMIMLDNWNEFSEGHWLLPTYGTPAYKDGRYTYGYLDVLREVFGIGEFAHTDYMPLEDGFGPYDTWYPVGWDKVNGCEIAIDNSVKETAIIDWQIGYDTMGGKTAFVKEITVGTEDVATLSVTDANRVVVSEQALATIKNAQVGVRVEMLNGTVTLSAEQVAAFNNDGFEIVLNVEVDLTDVAIAVRKTADGAYNICDGQVYTFSLKQGGYEVAEFEAEVEINEVSTNATGYALFDGDTVQKAEGQFDGNVKVTMVKNEKIVIIK